uniref:N-acetyltransferase domain-containing protein n=1 Tax=Caenorhabditis japonica TaxID=281687 RepID=A0A8R1HQ69_CAEJA
MSAAAAATVSYLPHALWIESVMIRQDLRGRGLGKQLMHETEKWMLENGFDEAFLCTEDQCRFYGSLGYEMCDRIVHSTTATSVFPAMEHFQTAAAISKPKAIEIKDKSCPAPPPSSAPPPPPPPPKMAPKTTSTGTSPINFNLVDEQYMRKRLKPL